MRRKNERKRKSKKEKKVKRSRNTKENVKTKDKKSETAHCNSVIEGVVNRHCKGESCHSHGASVKTKGHQSL